jgi:hypothetical protein
MFFCVIARRCLPVGAVLTALMVAGAVFDGRAAAAGDFPFGRELLLEAPPMRPGKRMPALTVDDSGNGVFDLWCRSVGVRLVLGVDKVQVQAEPLPTTPPAMQSAGQCTPERMSADDDLYVAFVTVSGWTMSGNTVTFSGMTPLRFTGSSH